ncbi:MAG: alcohol dehydrogenase catalytic domain-containing protein [Firmicutes bacterium]|nr:alcohol dehydrogenase catalytic domain-containing protein [Bacillota bacterium]
MKALVYEGPRQMPLKDVPPPEVVHVDDVIIQVAYSGICGSELSGFLGQNSLRKPPAIFGHEFSGTIVALGSQAETRYGLAAGMRVTANPLITCGHCAYCTEGEPQLCPERRLLGAALPGSHAEWLKVPAQNVYPLPPSVTLAQGALVEPIAYAAHVASLTQAVRRGTALILGMGPIGLFVLQALKAEGWPTVWAAESHEERRRMALDMGAESVWDPVHMSVAEAAREQTQGRGVDLVVDAVGLTPTRQQAVSAARSGGTVIWSGLHDNDSILPVHDMIRREIRALGAFAYTPQDFSRALSWLANGTVGLKSDWMVQAPLEAGAQWFAALIAGAAPGVAKVLLSPHGSA